MFRDLKFKLSDIKFSIVYRTASLWVSPLGSIKTVDKNQFINTLLAIYERDYVPEKKKVYRKDNYRRRQKAIPLYLTTENNHVSLKIQMMFILFVNSY
jgi:hypothetical protein